MLTSCYDFSFVVCKNHLTCIPGACTDQDCVSISVPERFYWLHESGTQKMSVFFSPPFFFFPFGKAMASSESWSRCDPQPLIPRHENGGTNGRHHDKALSFYIRVCDERAVECEIECFDLLLKKIIPIFYKSSLSFSDPEEIIVRVRVLRKKRKKKEREVRGGI